jgi:hypothetical protein
VDRSATAIAAARAGAAACVEAGTALFHNVALADVDPAALGRFDKILAVNVNLFWTQQVPHELPLLARPARPGGRLQLVYEPPSADRVAHVRDHVLAGLSHCRLPLQLGDPIDRSRGAARYRWTPLTPPRDPR